MLYRQAFDTRENSRILPILFLLTLLFAGSAAGAGPDYLTDAEKRWLADHPVVRLGVGVAFPPFQWVETKDDRPVFKGMVADYVKLLENRLGVEMKVVFGLTFKAALEKGRAKEIDLFPCLSKTPERSDFLLFTKPYLSYPLAVITRKYGPSVDTLEDLDGKRVATVKALSAYSKLINDHPELDIRFVETKTVGENLDAVSIGQADACIINLGVASYLIQKKGFTNLKIALPLEWETIQLAMGVRNDWPELLAILKKTIAALPEDETIRIRRRWIQIDYKPPLDMDLIWRWVGGAGLVASFVFVFFFLWNRSLQREVERRRRAEERLRLSAVELAIAKEKAEVANHAKSAFLTNMSHELRSPLNAILGFARLLAHDPSLPHENREYARIIRRGGKHLLTLINQVLDLSRIEAGRTTLDDTDFDLHLLLRDIEDMFALKTWEKHLKLIFQCGRAVPRYIRADEVKLRQVLINLLNNAVKFTEEGGVTVRIGVANLDGRTSGLPNLMFEIEDTGPGVAADEMDTIFEAFGQTAAGRLDREGTGLGLPISRKFVRLMGGDIRVRSAIGRGSVFSFDIRAKVADPTDIASSGPRRRVIALEPGQPRYRILIVDDQQPNRQLLTELLKPLGFELREAANGKEAVDIGLAWKPHLIWMDMRMPVLDGYKATMEIKSGLSNRFRTKIIALTASSFQQERSVALNAGCDDYLRKPFRETELFGMMGAHLGVRFVYADEIPSPVRPVLKPEALAALPESWLNKLKVGAHRADLIQISRVIEQIRERDTALADALARLAENFDYDGILALIGNSKISDAKKADIAISTRS